MKLYYKVKVDGKWKWIAASDCYEDDAYSLCECRVCKPAEPNVVSQEEE